MGSWAAGHIIGQLGRLSPLSLLYVVGGLLGFISRSLCRRLLAGFGFQPCIGRIKLGLQGLPPDYFGWQRLWIDIGSIGGNPPIFNRVRS